MKGDALSVVPRDGLRQRFAAIIADPKDPKRNVRRFKLKLDRDGFAPDQNIVTDKSLRKVAFTLENRTGDEHATGLWLSLPAGMSYDVLQNGKKVALSPTGNWDYPLRAELKITRETSKIELFNPR